MIDSEEKHLVDLKWPQLLPENPLKPVPAQDSVAANDGPDDKQTFQLTGWRGAGWHMVFPEEPAE